MKDVKNIDFYKKICNNKYMEKIGILGGTFDPVHLEHVRLAKCAIEELALDKLFVMPTFIPPHKSVLPTDSKERLEMLTLAFSGLDKVVVSDFEIQKQGKSYTYQTVEYFKQNYNAQIYFICGGDMLTDFRTWRYPERILSACDLAVFGREDFFTDYDKEKEYFEKTFNKSFIKLNYVGKSLSSTKIRVYSAFNLNVDEVTMPQVANYIKEKNLYKADKYVKFIIDNFPEKRIRHTANVVITALKRAKELGLDQEKVRITATLHDCAKYIDHTTVEGFTLPSDVPSPVVHAFLGAFIAEKVLGVTDDEILDAIRYHTSGKAKMTTLGKLIFVADMVEEDRVYQGVEQLRALYESADFEDCFVQCLKEEFIHLLNKKQRIYEETLNAFSYYVKE